MAKTMKKLGLIINPIAGMGGTVGLKGTDGVLSEAIARGAAPHATEKTIRALRKLLPLIQDAEEELAEAKGVKATSEKEAGTEADKLTIITCGGDMGETVLLEFLAMELSDSKAKLSYEVVYTPPNIKKSADDDSLNSASIEYKNMTCAEDTIAGAKAIAAAGADIIAFVGGDGTARDIYEAVSESLPVLGIPAGVKIYSPVYAQSPEKAGELLRLYLRGQTIFTKETEVLDINEEDYRNDIINTSVYGYLRVPYERRFLQSRKAPSPMSEEARQRAIAAYVAEEIMQSSSQDVSKNNADNAEIEEDTYYIIGPGSTTRCLADYLGVENTLLGVDIVHCKQTATKTDTTIATKTAIKTVVKDATEQEILAYLEANPNKLKAGQTADSDKKEAGRTADSDKPVANRDTMSSKPTTPSAKQVKLIITPTGGQGYLLGRGNQQISGQVIKKLKKNNKKSNILVIATPEKLAGLLGNPLRVDTGDFEADELLKGYIRVVTGYREIQMYLTE